MVGAVNGHSVEIDLGADRDTRPAKPCARHFAPGRWCTLAEAHPGACEGPAASSYGPPGSGEKLCRGGQ